MESSPKQIELIKKLENITNSAIPYEKRGGVSDANIVASCNTITIDGFGPFGDGDHTIHERANKKSFAKRVEQVTKILSYFNAHQPNLMKF